MKMVKNECKTKKQPIDELIGPYQKVIHTEKVGRGHNRLICFLNERVKELKCIYDINRVVSRPNITLDEVYRNVTNMLPDGWHHPHIPYARIAIDGKEFKTKNYKKTKLRLSSDIWVQGVKAGVVEVNYLNPDIEKEPFLKGKRCLIDVVAEQLGIITEGRRMEEALRESRETLKYTFELVTNGIIVMNLEGIIGELNEGLLRMTGNDDNAEKLIGRSILELIAPQDYHSVIVNLEKTIKEGATIDIEYSFLKTDGSEFVGATSTSVLRDASGNPVGFLATVRDITEHKRLKKLEYSLGERVRELECLSSITHITERMWLTVDELYQEVINLLPASSGYPRIECARIAIDGKEFKTKNYKKSKLRLSSDIWVQGVKAGAVEVNYLNPDIEKEPFLSEAKMYFETVAKRLGDIAEYIRARDALRDSEEFSSSLLNSAPVPILVINPDTSIRYVNPALEKVTGFCSSKLVGKKPPYPWWTDKDLDKKIGDLDRNICEQTRGVEVLCKKKNGEQFWAEMNFVPVENNGELKYCVSSWIETTEQKRLRENLHLYIMEVTRTQEKERERIAHELHDETIQALFSLLTDVNEAIMVKRQVSKEGIQRLEKLKTKIDGIMNEVRRFSHELRPGLLDEFGLIPSLELLINEGRGRGKLHSRMEIIGSKQRLTPETELVLFRIIQEALHNIRKHSMATKAVIRIQFNKKKVELNIIDNGCGFKLPKVLSGFVHKGKLGLMTMNERARLLNGSFSVKSDVGKGTTIVVKIPA